MADINRWLCAMQDHATTTVHRRLSALSSFFKTGLVLGYAATDPAEHIERPALKRTLMPVLSDADVAKLLSAAEGPMAKAMILTLATTGVRRAELVGIRVEDVDWQRQRIRVRGKGGQHREVIISPELQRGLWVYLDHTNLSDQAPLFASRIGRQFHNSTLQRWFRGWLKATGLQGKGYTLHSLRRYAATRWLRHGLNVREIQVLLGHQSPETTARYLNVDLAQIQEHLSQLPPITGQPLGSLDHGQPDEPAPLSGPVVSPGLTLCPDNLGPLVELVGQLDSRTVDYLLQQAQLVRAGGAKQDNRVMARLTTA